MAVAAGTTKTYDRVGIREDLTDLISNVDPVETPFYSNCGKTEAKNTYHEWQTDSYREASDANARLEGDDATAVARAPRVRLGNHTQISSEVVLTSGTARAVNEAGVSDEHLEQLVKAGIEIKRDMEVQLLSSQAKNAGNSTTARVSAGVGSWISSNFNGGTGAVAPTGDGSDSLTAGADRAVAESHLTEVMQDIFNATGKRDGYMAMMPADIKSKITTNYSGQVTRYTNVDANSRAPIIGATDFYISDFGKVEFVPNVFMTAKSTYILKKDTWKVAYLRGMKNEKLAKSGDADKEQIICEYALQCQNEKANGHIAAQSPTL